MASTGIQPHILCINHTPEILALLDELLSEEGYRVSTRGHLDRDLRDLRAIRPDLIIVDYMWPTTDDNWALLQLIRLDPELRSVPIILCTGAIAEARRLSEHLAAMRIRVVWKPFDIDQLLQAVDGSLNHDRPGEVDPLR